MLQGLGVSPVTCLPAGTYMGGQRLFWEHTSICVLHNAPLRAGAFGKDSIHESKGRIPHLCE